MTPRIPDYLSWARILIVPLIITLGLLYPKPPQWINLAMTVLFIVAALTDFLDGYFARRFNWQTKFGAFIDPVADKLVVIPILLLLLAQDRIHFLIVVVIICREICVSALREWMAEIGNRTAVKVSVLGKIKTISQLLGIGCVLYQQDIGIIPVEKLGIIILWIAVLLTVISMIDYLRNAWPYLKNQ